jgi:hypothetical protein
VTVAAATLLLPRQGTTKPVYVKTTRVSENTGGCVFTASIPGKFHISRVSSNNSSSACYELLTSTIELWSAD